MDMNLGKLQQIVRNREAWHAAVHGVAKRQTELSTCNAGRFSTAKPPGACKYTIHFELIFMYGVTKGQVSFFPYGYPYEPVPFTEKTILFPLNFCNAFVVNQAIGHIYVDLFLNSILFHGLLFIVYQDHTFKISLALILGLFFLFKIALVSPLYFHKSFTNSFQISTN